jgi:hypothetical protein
MIDRIIKRLKLIKEGIKLSLFFKKVVGSTFGIITFIDLYEILKGNVHHLIGKVSLNLIRYGEFNYTYEYDDIYGSYSVVVTPGIEIKSYLGYKENGIPIRPDLSLLTVPISELKFMMEIPIFFSYPLEIGEDLCHDIYWEIRRIEIKDTNDYLL